MINRGPTTQCIAELPLRTSCHTYMVQIMTVAPKTTDLFQILNRLATLFQPPPPLLEDLLKIKFWEMCVFLKYKKNKTVVLTVEEIVV